MLGTFLQQGKGAGFKGFGSARILPHERKEGKDDEQLACVNYDFNWEAASRRCAIAAAAMLMK